MTQSWLDDKLRLHPKWINLTVAARELWCETLLYVNEKLTDGIVYKKQLFSEIAVHIIREGYDLDKLIQELLDVNLWEIRRGKTSDDMGQSYVFHDFFDHRNFRRDQVMSYRERGRKRAKDSYSKKRFRSEYAVQNSLLDVDFETFDEGGSPNTQINCFPNWKAGQIRNNTKLKANELETKSLRYIHIPSPEENRSLDHGCDPNLPPPYARDARSGSPGGGGGTHTPTADNQQVVRSKYRPSSDLLAQWPNVSPTVVQTTLKRYRREGHLDLGSVSEHDSRFAAFLRQSTLLRRRKEPVPDERPDAPPQSRPSGIRAAPGADPAQPLGAAAAPGASPPVAAAGGGWDHTHRMAQQRRQALLERRAAKRAELERVRGGDD